MIELAPHTGFIVAAYAAAFVIIGGLVLQAVLDYRLQQRALADFEARGVHRRSARRGNGSQTGTEQV